MDVLIVEDNPGDADLIRAYLEGAERAAESIERLGRLEQAMSPDREPPDVVLLDLNLPDASPDETIEAIRTLAEESAVVVMTGRAGEDLELRALKAGADEFLEKGRIDDHLLERCIDHAIQRHNMLTALRKRERELERYRIIVEHSTDAVRMKDASGRFRLVNERYKELFGRSDSEVIGRTTSDVFEPEDADDIKRRDREVIEHGLAETDEEERETEQGEQTFLTTRIPYEIDGEVEGVVAISRDVTERREMREELEHQALYDKMTGLPNRTLFRDRLRQTIERSRRRGGSFGLAFLDLDDFKDVNDSLGHKAGDSLLEKVGDRLRGMVRGEDTAARIGGDEFTIILQSVEGRSALESVGTRIRKTFDTPFTVEGIEVYVDVSVGFAYPSPEMLREGSFEEVFESLTRAADREMYRSKEVPGTGWRITKTTCGGAGERRIQRENRIREAIEAREFEPHFQPVVGLESGDLLAVEMLARWRDPDRGLVSPAEFIPVAENSALIDGISRVLVERACEQLQERDAGGRGPMPGSLYVNISARQVERPEVLDELREILDARLPAGMGAAFEVTETALLRREIDIGAVRESGVRILVDDFGTGHSSLSRLKEMPADGIKLDMEFVQGIGDEPADEALVETMVELGRRLGLPMVAEGVETREQYEFLRDVGCRAAQGYWLGRPGPLEELCGGEWQRLGA